MTRYATHKNSFIKKKVIRDRKYTGIYPDLEIEIRHQPTHLLKYNLKIGEMSKRTENIIRDELKKRRALMKYYRKKQTEW